MSDDKREGLEFKVYETTSMTCSGCPIVDLEDHDSREEALAGLSLHFEQGGYTPNYVGPRDRLAFVAYGGCIRRLCNVKDS